MRWLFLNGEKFNFPIGYRFTYLTMWCITQRTRPCWCTWTNIWTLVHTEWRKWLRNRVVTATIRSLRDGKAIVCAHVIKEQPFVKWLFLCIGVMTRLHLSNVAGEYNTSHLVLTWILFVPLHLLILFGMGEGYTKANESIFNEEFNKQPL